MEEVGFQESWSIKKIILAIVVMILLVVVGYFSVTKIFTLDINNFFQKPSTKQSLSVVQGASTKNRETAKQSQKENLFLPLVNTLQTDASQKLESIKEEANKLNLEEVASSSPQMQKVINDIKSLQNYPKDQAKEMCQKICDGI